MQLLQFWCSLTLTSAMISTGPTDQPLPAVLRFYGITLRSRRALLPLMYGNGQTFIFHLLAVAVCFMDDEWSCAKHVAKFGEPYFLPEWRNSFPPWLLHIPSFTPFYLAAARSLLPSNLTRRECCSISQARTSPADAKLHPANDLRHKLPACVCEVPRFADASGPFFRSGAFGRWATILHLVHPTFIFHGIYSRHFAEALEPFRQDRRWCSVILWLTSIKPIVCTVICASCRENQPKPSTSQ